MDIRPFIKSKREQLNLSRQELAAYCCIDESELRMLEDDDVRLPKHRAEAIMKILAFELEI